LPAPNAGKRYYGRDQQDPAGVQLYVGNVGDPEEGGPDGEENGDPLEPGSYVMTGEDGDAHRHVYRQDDQPQNVGSKPIEHMGNALSELNRVNDRFWRDVYSGNGASKVPVNVAAAASAVQAVMKDRGITGDSSMIGQKALAGMNALNRRHYDGHVGAHDAQVPKATMPSPAAINAANRRRWGSGNGGVGR